MAEIFTNIFGEKLARENLVELNNLNRLPSPHQLQRKIILKGTQTSLAKSPTKLSVRETHLSIHNYKCILTYVHTYMQTYMHTYHIWLHKVTHINCMG